VKLQARKVPWHDIARTPKLFIFHISIFVPAAFFWLFEGGYWVLLGWIIGDLFLQYKKITLVVLLLRVLLFVRNFVRGDVRNKPLQ